jgi:hypothetical protein
MTSFTGIQTEIASAFSTGPPKASVYSDSAIERITWSLDISQGIWTSSGTSSETTIPIPEILGPHKIIIGANLSGDVPEDDSISYQIVAYTADTVVDIGDQLTHTHLNIPTSIHFNDGGATLMDSADDYKIGVLIKKSNSYSAPPALIQSTIVLSLVMITIS